MTCAMMQAVNPMQSTSSSIEELSSDTVPAVIYFKQWKSMFPDFSTLTGSVQFIKKLMAVSLSAITYIRGVFPEKAYGERDLCGIKLKLLTSDSGIDGVNKFIDLIRSCYDAVEKKYLHQLSVGVCTDIEHKDEVLESYNMSFRYRDDEYSVTCNNKKSPSWQTEKDPTVSATLLLLKSIITMDDILGPLPKNAYLTMKLLYNDEITPPGYEPPGFEPSECERFHFSSSAVKLELGKVATDLHGYKMFLKTTMSKEPLNQYLEESVLNDSQKSRDSAKSQDQQATEEYNPEAMIQGSQSGALERNLQKIVADEEIECPCNCKQDSGTGIIQCMVCLRKQHSICYGILKPDENEPTFYCTQCINEAPFGSSHLDLVHSYEKKEQQELCAFRRALVFCSSLKNITVPQLEKHLGCNKLFAKNLIERLEFERFITKGTNKHKYIVNGKKIINNGYQEYFPQNENKENSESLKKSKISKEKTSKMKTVLEKGPSRISLRRSQTMRESDSFDEVFASQPKKKRCLNTREAIKSSK